ncbi:putative uncharacterized protein DDB_G0274405 [Onthophagus taurus]|uniref:putative uncharacterized protein DDB_G0274405 n=1 Tax=Onthophagus taurus TaxID=166361 RepID=UPI0039BE36BA
MNGFKITVNLVEFFNDHRRFCRMFVNLNRMETINDLQEHIAKTFNLNNFYLMAEKQFLPGTESIQILNVNDCISVAPLPQNSNTVTKKPCPQQQLEENNNSSSENEAIENGKNKRRKKNKEKVYPNKKLKNSFTVSNERLWGSTPIENNEQPNNDENVTKKTSKRNKTLKRTNLTTKIDGGKVDDDVDENGTHNSVKDKVEYFEKHTDVINLNQSQENEKDIAPETVNISDVMKNHKLFVKPNDSLKLISTKLPQQQNVIKNIVVCTSKETSGFESIEPSTDSIKTTGKEENDINTLKDSNQKDTKVNIIQDIVIPQELIEITDNSVNVEVMEVENSTISDTTECLSISSIIQENVVKRKRVRTRKRKLKNVQPEEKTNFKTNFNFKINLPKPSPSIHIKFDDDGNMKNLKNVGNQSNKYEESEQVIVVDLSTKVSENDDVEYVPNENEIEMGKHDQINDQAIIKTEMELLELLPEMIEKYPLLQEESLQEGNVIAFKLLKLGDFLIPDMTNYIIGKIMGVNNDGKDVVINVIGGLEEAKTAAESLCEGDEFIDVTETTRKYEKRHLLCARLISKHAT